MERPFGVTILAILAFLEALMAFGSAALAGTMFAWMKTMMGGYGYGPIGFFVGLGLIGAAIAAIIGIIYLLLAWGLWTGQGWAWTVTLIFTILGLIGSIIALIAMVGIVPLIINIINTILPNKAACQSLLWEGPCTRSAPTTSTLIPLFFLILRM